MSGIARDLHQASGKPRQALRGGMQQTPSAPRAPTPRVWLRLGMLTAKALDDQLSHETFLDLDRQIQVLQQCFLQPKVSELQVGLLKYVPDQGDVQLLLVHRLEYFGEDGLQPG